MFNMFTYPDPGCVSIALVPDHRLQAQIDASGLVDQRSDTDKVHPRPRIFLHIVQA